jgi:hypothetical protein
VGKSWISSDFSEEINFSIGISRKSLKKILYEKLRKVPARNDRKDKPKEHSWETAKLNS